MSCIWYSYQSFIVQRCFQNIAYIEASGFNIDCGLNFIQRDWIDVKMGLGYVHFFVNINFCVAAKVMVG